MCNNYVLYISGLLIYLLHPCTQIPVYYLNSNRPELDLLLLGKADFFVGNCVSAFSAFVKSERDVSGKLSEFFALEELKSDVIRMNRRIEL